jgi:hypothetical protein
MGEKRNGASVNIQVNEKRQAQLRKQGSIAFEPTIMAN